jgi:hypothetical protein
MLVIEAKAGDSRQQRPLDDIGGVEPAAEPDLQDGGVGWIPREGKQGDGSRDLEEAWFDAGAKVENFGQKLHERLIIDQAASDADALVEAD